MSKPFPYIYFKFKNLHKMLPRDYYPVMLPDIVYHIYNRGNNRDTIFYQERNYNYFLSKYKTYIAPFVDTYAYCLLPNHIHFLIRVKGSDAFFSSDEFRNRQSEDFPSFQNLESLKHKRSQMEETLYSAISAFISEQFRRLFMAYAKAINKQENRSGSLFQKNFKRLAVEDETHFSNLIFYIHANPALHKTFNDFIVYPHSSYKALLSNKSTSLEREHVLSFFGSRKRYINFHRQYLQFKDIEEFRIEE